MRLTYIRCMKKTTIILALAVIGLSSCAKQRDYLCTVEQVNPEGINYHTVATVTFRGTYYEMKKFESDGTFTGPNQGAWQTTTCK